MMYNIQSIIERIMQLASGKQGAITIVAIDGRCGAGKTTLAQKIGEKVDCTFFRMDDFFLRPEQRTAERLAQPGGNVDRERFFEEVLAPLSKGEREIVYRPFDCSRMELGESVRASCRGIVLVEGSYSCHPELWDSYDLHIFADISPEGQLERITAREGEQKAQIFKSRWIPLEERYFGAFGIREKCELVVNMG